MKLHIGGEQAKEGWKIFSIQKKDNVDFLIWALTIVGKKFFQKKLKLK